MLKSLPKFKWFFEMRDVYTVYDLQMDEVTVLDFQSVAVVAGFRKTVQTFRLERLYIILAFKLD
jgi:hypothetical protein